MCFLTTFAMKALHAQKRTHRKENLFNVQTSMCRNRVELNTVTSSQSSGLSANQKRRFNYNWEIIKYSHKGDMRCWKMHWTNSADTLSISLGWKTPCGKIQTPVSAEKLCMKSRHSLSRRLTLTMCYTIMKTKHNNDQMKRNAHFCAWWVCRHARHYSLQRGTSQ